MFGEILSVPHIYGSAGSVPGARVGTIQPQVISKVTSLFGVGSMPDALGVPTLQAISLPKARSCLPELGIFASGEPCVPVMVRKVDPPWRPVFGIGN